MEATTADLGDATLTMTRPHPRPGILLGIVEAFTRAREDRKPGPGMAKAAQTALNLDLLAWWVVGDRHEDIELAEAIGAPAVYVGADRCERPRVWSFPSLAAAAPFILERIAV